MDAQPQHLRATFPLLDRGHNVLTQVTDAIAGAAALTALMQFAFALWMPARAVRVTLQRGAAKDGVLLHVPLLRLAHVALADLLMLAEPFPVAGTEAARTVLALPLQGFAAAEQPVPMFATRGSSVLADIEHCIPGPPLSGKSAAL